MNNDLRLRGTWGESFQTPLPAQQFGTASLTGGLSTVKGFPDFNFDTFNANFVGTPLASTSDEFDDLIDVTVLSGGILNLDPQIADTLTFGFDYNPSFVPGLNLGVTYSRASFDNYIGAVPSFSRAGSGFRDFAEDPRAFPEIFLFNSDETLLIIDQRVRNLASRKSEAVDILVDYEFETDFGSWLLALNAQRSLRLDEQVSPIAPVSSFNDSEFGPSEWTANFTAGWNHGDYSATVVVNYQGDHRVIEPLVPIDTSDPVASIENSGSYTTVDLQVGYSSPADSGWAQGMRVSLGAQNLFDPDFPFVDNQIGYLTNRVNTRSRVLYLDITKAFDL